MFAGAPWRVGLEQELVLISQELDVAIIEEVASEGQPRLPDPLPDGLENLRAINLLSYKSHYEALDTWSLDELIGYYVLYRKVNLTARTNDTRSGPLGCTLWPHAIPRDWRATMRCNPRLGMAFTSCPVAVIRCA